jgi:AbrB family looped-hinge helix DNA binding protein
MNDKKARIGPGGRIVIPAAYRKAMGVGPGDDVVLSLDSGQLKIVSPREALRRAQSIVRRHVAAGRRLSDELVAERRAEAKSE